MGIIKVKLVIRALWRQQKTQTKTELLQTFFVVVEKIVFGFTLKIVTLKRRCRQPWGSI